VIFVTVGSQMQFDRLVRSVDAWAAERGRRDVFAQIGDGEYAPSHVEWTRRLDPEAFDARFREATLVVAHAGTGSILQALELGKPLIVMPRRAALRETRNDHQVATAERFQSLAGIVVAWDEQELAAHLDAAQVGKAPEGAREPRVGPHASPRLLGRSRGFLET
jgi:UDP-N-acetylglucosamine transferase subunit ALG13